MAITKIMVVEDDSDDRKLFTEAVARLDTVATIQFALDGVDALEQLAADEVTDVQLILLDVNMPRMNGWETLSRLKTDIHFRDIPVIMFSTSSASGDVERALRLGAIAFISKPADFVHLIHLVSVIISLPKDNVERVVQDYNPS